MSLLFTGLYAKCPSYLLDYMQNVLIIYWLICKISLLFTGLYAICAGRAAVGGLRQGAGAAVLVAAAGTRAQRVLRGRHYATRRRVTQGGALGSCAKRRIWRYGT